MHVLCFGAGAIGSLVGARLSLGGVAVTLLARRAHVAAIRTSLDEGRWVDVGAA